jgi:hypothetical protein
VISASVSCLGRIAPIVVFLCLVVVLCNAVRLALLAIKSLELSCLVWLLDHSFGSIAEVCAEQSLVVSAQWSVLSGCG